MIVRLALKSLHNRGGTAALTIASIALAVVLLLGATPRGRDVPSPGQVRVQGFDLLGQGGALGRRARAEVVPRLLRGQQARHELADRAERHFQVHLILR